MHTPALHFKITAYEGLAETSGLIKAEEDTLRVQFQTADAVVGFIKSDIKDIVIPVEAIDEIGFKKSIWGNKVTMRVNRLDILHAFPSQNSSELTLSIARKDADLAAEFVSAVRLNVAEYQYDQAMGA